MDAARRTDGPEPAVQGPPTPAERQALRLVEKREHSLLSLFELSHELSVSLDLYNIADMALFSLMGHFGAPRGALWLLLEDAPTRAVLIRFHGVREDVARAIGDGLAAHVADEYTYEQSPVLFSEWASNLRAPGAALGQAMGFAVLAPVTSHGRLLGMVALGGRLNGEAFGELDLSYVSAACGMVGVAVENTRHYFRMVETNRRLHKANEELAELNRLKGELVQNVNHELRTPLSVMLGYLHHMATATGFSEEQRKMMGIVVDQAEKLAGLVENLLDFSALSAHGLTLRCERGDVVPTVASWATRRRPGVIEGLREFDSEIAGPLPAVSFDARRLVQALDLVLDNALKFTPLGTRIRLRVDGRDQDGRRWVRVQLEDNGPGIHKQHLETLFDAFRQVDGSTTRAAGGMGLGLALVREIAQRMGGRLDVASEWGQGTSVSLLLPVE